MCVAERIVVYMAQSHFYGNKQTKSRTIFLWLTLFLYGRVIVILSGQLKNRTTLHWNRRFEGEITLSKCNLQGSVRKNSCQLQKLSSSLGLFDLTKSYFVGQLVSLWHTLKVDMYISKNSVWTCRAIKFEIISFEYNWSHHCHTYRFYVSICFNSFRFFNKYRNHVDLFWKRHQKFCWKIRFPKTARKSLIKIV